MSKNIINIGIPSKGRLRKDILKIFKKNKLNLVSERGERDLIGAIKQLKNVKVLYLHAREIVERLGDGSLDLGFSGYDLLKESEVNTQNKINVTKKYDVEIDEIDVCPVQIQGPLSEDLMAKLAGEELREIPYYGLMECKVGGADCVISQTGFTGEKGYEIYVRDAHANAEKMWNAVLEAGEEFGLMVIAPAHHRRIAAGILSWGQDLDHETSPFQVNLSYQVPRNKKSDYIGKEELERQRAIIDEGNAPFKMKMVGITLGGKEITNYAPDFWLVTDTDDKEVGYVTSPWWSPELETNIALAWVPWEASEVGTKYKVKLPDEYSETPGVSVDAEIVDVPFRESVNPNKREVEAAKGLDFAE